ncbi:UvrD-helicase domain-containing protein [Xylophilus rhododendri]|uniref:DNA 3'-5' helicase n=1 Tax=Xylophilus rhododendri TaxID=2697032 RepID=A0A857J789_9BURK|nr:ATP-dependent helicase [Xylophilus rhododendri]QHI99844.1 UvrD-helicase domain-containing protein [Xylophilus rhododendri]
MPSPHSPVSPASTAFDSLNERQRESVFFGDGPLLIVAGAGSGKTTTLAHRVARLVLDGADPQRMLLLTFSRRAAVDMERRIGGVLQKVLGIAGKSGQAPSLPWAGTFHGIGSRLLREHAAAIGLEDNFTIHDRGDAEDLMGIVRHTLGFSSTAKRFPMKGTCLGIYSRCVNTRMPLEQVLREAYPWCAEWEAELKQLFGAYVDAKQQQNTVDYDDLLLFWADMAADPAIGPLLAERFDHVLVDEYQDTNRLQATILLGLKPEGRGLTVVGDDAQAIYSFRGATVRNILDFPAQFEPPATVIALERNYRSTQPILQVSNAVIARAAERHAKRLWTDKASTRRSELVVVPDEMQQARWVAERTLSLREGGLRLTSQAVLFRTASHSAALELELARRNIPFVKFGGLKFLEAAHVKDLLAVLRFVQNPRSRLAGFRVLQLMPGLGAATAGRLLDAMEASPDPAGVIAGFRPKPSLAGDWQAFATLYAALRDAQQSSWPGDAERALAWYVPHLERIHEDAETRRADLEQLVRLAAGHGSRERFLAELTLDPPESTSDKSGVPLLDEDYLILSTIHSAKGQEWTSVSVLNVVDGCIPSDMATGDSAEIEEERRLLYVAMTRAREHLHLVVPHRFYVTQQARNGDRHMYAARSRFIDERAVLDFDQVFWPPPAAGTAGPRVAARMEVGVRQRSRDAWK